MENVQYLHGRDKNGFDTKCRLQRPIALISESIEKNTPKK